MGGAPILCDARMVANGITRTRLPAGNEIVCTLDDPSVRSDALTLAEYDQCATAAGLMLADRFSTWDRAPYDGGNYAVSVHRAV